MSRRGASSIAANPVLIGAATTLVIIVAVFLAYNANNGLPFVPTYELSTNVPSAANLVKGNEVRIGGSRIGVVDEIIPKRGANGQYYAQLHMKLQTTVKPLPVDSSILIRSRSALGLKYVEITKGKSAEGFQEGATVPVRNQRPRAVEIDEVLNTFDARTREATQVNLLEFGNALAGRGQDVNRAIEELNPLLRDLAPVMSLLSAKETRLAELFQALGRTSAQIAPVAQTQADMFTNLDRTFAALAEVAPEIQESISGAPPAMDAAIRSFRVQRPFLANNEGLFRELRPGVRALRGSAPALADAFATGRRTLRRSVAFNERLEPTFAALQRFTSDPLVTLGIRDLRRTAEILRPTIANLRPVQTTCNYMSLWFRNVASLLSEGDKNGTWQRFIIVATPQGPNNEGGPSSAPANGPSEDNHAHVNPYPEVSTTECEAANEPYLKGQTIIGNVPGKQRGSTEKTTRSLTD